MGTQITLDRFLEFEEKNGLLKEEVDGFYWWQYIRAYVYYLSVAHPDVIYRNNKKTTISSKLKFIVGTIINTIGHPTVLTAPKADILILTDPGRIKDGDSYRSTFTEDISDYYRGQSVSLEYSINLSHLKPTATKPLFYLDYLRMKSIVINKIAKKKKSLAKQFYPIALKLSEQIESQLGEKTDVNMLLGMISSAYHTRRTTIGYFDKIIKKVSPKVMLIVDAYSNMPIVESGKKNGVPVLELQHGVIGRGHISYNFLRKQSLVTFPDKVLLFSDYWENARFPVENENIIVTGSPYLEKMKQIYPHAERKDKKRIIVISQPVVSVMLAKVISAFIDMAKKHGVMNDYSIKIKLHPMEYDDEGSLNVWSQCAENKNVEVCEGRDYPINYYLSDSDVLVAVNSTVIFEGLGYDLETYLLHDSFSEAYVSDIVKEGYAGIINNGEELFQCLQSRVKQNQAEPDKFYTLDSMNKFVEVIDRHI